MKILVGTFSSGHSKIFAKFVDNSTVDTTYNNYLILYRGEGEAAGRLAQVGLLVRLPEHARHLEQPWFSG